MSVRVRLAVLALVLGTAGCSDLATEPSSPQSQISALIVPGDVAPGDTMMKYLTAGMDYKVGYYDSSLSYMNAMIDSIDNGSMRAYMFGSAQSLVASSTPSQSFSESPISIFGGGIRPLLIYRGVESLAGYMADQSEGAGGPPHSISCANMRQAAISSNRALSQMTNTVRTFSPSTQETVFALSGPAYDAGYSFLANKTFSPVGSFATLTASLTAPLANFAADYSKATIQNAFIKAFLTQCP